MCGKSRNKHSLWSFFMYLSFSTGEDFKEACVYPSSPHLNEWEQIWTSLNTEHLHFVGDCIFHRESDGNHVKKIIHSQFFAHNLKSLENSLKLNYWPVIVSQIQLNKPSSESKRKTNKKQNLRRQSCTWLQTDPLEQGLWLWAGHHWECALFQSLVWGGAGIIIHLVFLFLLCITCVFS